MAKKAPPEVRVAGLMVKEINLLRSLVKAQNDLLYYRETGPIPLALQAQELVAEISGRLESLYSR